MTTNSPGRAPDLSIPLNVLLAPLSPEQDPIGYSELDFNASMAALGLRHPRRIFDDEARHHGVSRKPDSASLVVVSIRRSWLFFGGRHMVAKIRVADPRDTEWVLAELDRLAPPLGALKSYRLRVLGPNVALVRGLVARGYAIDGVTTVGTLTDIAARLSCPPLPSGVTTRDAQPDDVAHIIAISRALEHEGLIIPRSAVLPHRTPVLRHIRNRTKLAILLEVDRQIVGFIAVSLGVYRFEAVGHAGLEIMIRPEHRGRGFARILYHQCFERLALYQRQLAQSWSLDAEDPNQPVVLVVGMVAHPATQHLSAHMGRVPYLLTAHHYATSTAPLLALLERYEALGVGAPLRP